MNYVEIKNNSTINFFQLNCFDTISAECFDKERQLIKRNNFLYDEFERANNNSDVLGQDFIDSCPTLSQNEDEIIKVLNHKFLQK